MVTLRPQFGQNRPPVDGVPQLGQVSAVSGTSYSGGHDTPGGPVCQRVMIPSASSRASVRKVSTRDMADRSRMSSNDR